MKRITEYQSSNGQVANYVVDQIGADGYKDLCKKSKEWLDGFLKSGEITNPDEIQALTEMRDSYDLSERGEQPKKAWTKEEGPDIEYLFHCVLVECEIIKPKPEPKKPRGFKSEVTRFKHLYRTHKDFPLKNYLGCLKLAPGKYQKVEEVTL